MHKVDHISSVHVILSHAFRHSLPGQFKFGEREQILQQKYPGILWTRIKSPVISLTFLFLRVPGKKEKKKTQEEQITCTVNPGARLGLGVLTLDPVQNFSHNLQCVHARSLQSCPALCSSKDCSLPGSSVHGILQARILEWVAMLFSRGSSRPRDQTHVS